jgi:hypothetical protein
VTEAVVCKLEAFVVYRSMAKVIVLIKPNECFRDLPTNLSGLRERIIHSFPLLTDYWKVNSKRSSLHIHWDSRYRSTRPKRKRITTLTFGIHKSTKGSDEPPRMLYKSNIHTYQHEYRKPYSTVLFHLPEFIISIIKAFNCASSDIPV